MNIKIEKRNVIAGVIVALVLALYNVLYFVIPFANRDISGAAYWTSYGFTTGIFVILAIAFALGFASDKLTSRVFGISVFKFAVSIAIVQLVLDAVTMTVGSLLKETAFPAWIVAVVESVLVVILIIGIIAKKAYIEHIEAIDKQEVRESYIKELRIELESLLARVDEKHPLHKCIESVYEDAKYADPVSHPELGAIEDQISAETEKLTSYVKNGNNDEAEKSAKELSLLIKERNTRAKALH